MYICIGRIFIAAKNKPQKCPESRNLANIIYKFVLKAPFKCPEVAKHVHIYGQNFYRSQNEPQKSPEFGNLANIFFPKKSQESTKYISYVCAQGPPERPEVGRKACTYV
jgi:hypothetical protein